MFKPSGDDEERRLAGVCWASVVGNRLSFPRRRPANAEWTATPALVEPGPSKGRNAAICLALGLAVAFAAADVRADAGGAGTAMTGAASLHAYENFLNRVQRGEMQIVRYDAGAFSLAELGEQARRASAQESGAVAVVYPDLGEPYRSVFAKIIEGIEEASTMDVRSYPVGANTDSVELNAQLKRQGIRAVIALGRQGFKAASAIDRDLPVVVGGVLSVPETDNRNLSGVSLTPDPALLFSRLKSLLPAVRRVIVVYNPQNNDWLIRLAREAARAQGLELAAYEARDLASAARLYEAAFAGSEGRRDAVWLPQDATTVDETTILPLVLRESWNRNIPVFSSSFLHVKKGALFALYPNNVELGRTLASSAVAAISGESRRRGVVPLREVQIAVNLRTANHIGLNIGYQQQRSFDFIFPEP